MGPREQCLMDNGRSKWREGSNGREDHRSRKRHQEKELGSRSHGGKLGLSRQGRKSMGYHKKYSGYVGQNNPRVVAAGSGRRSRWEVDGGGGGSETRIDRSLRVRSRRSVDGKSEWNRMDGKG
jgi:hypothetical protein